MKSMSTSLCMRTGAILILAAASLLIACKKGPQQKGSNDTRETVTLCYSAEPLAFLVPAARDNGFLLQEGLDLALKRYPSGKKALEAMFAGDCAIASVST